MCPSSQGHPIFKVEGVLKGGVEQSLPANLEQGRGGLTRAAERPSQEGSEPDAGIHNMCAIDKVCSRFLPSLKQAPVRAACLTDASAK